MIPKKITAFFHQKYFSYESAMEPHEFERSMHVLLNRNPDIPGKITLTAYRLNSHEIVISTRFIPYYREKESITRVIVTRNKETDSKPGLMFYIKSNKMDLASSVVYFLLGIFFWAINFFFIDPHQNEKLAPVGLAIASVLPSLLLGKIIYQNRALKKEIISYFRLIEK